MISLGIGRPERETRDSYSEQVISARVDAVSGSTASDALGAIETCAGLWERAFASGRSPVLSRWQMAMIGRGLLLAGASVWHVRGARRPRIEAVSSWDIDGGAEPASWTYRLSIASPKGTRTVTGVPAGRVLHARIGARESHPWRGCSPFTASRASRDVLKNLERQLALEAGGPVGSIIPVPQPSQELADDVRDVGGSVVLGESGPMGHDDSRRPVNEWQPRRIGFDAPESEGSIRRDVQRVLFSAAGVPPNLVDPQGGAAVRELWRAFLFGTIMPVAGLVGEELGRLGLASDIDFSDLQASDVQGRARAYKSLTDAGLPEADARRIVGI